MGWRGVAWPLGNCKNKLKPVQTKRSPVLRHFSVRSIVWWPFTKKDKNLILWTTWTKVLHGVNYLLWNVQLCTPLLLVHLGLNWHVCHTGHQAMVQNRYHTTLARWISLRYHLCCFVEFTGLYRHLHLLESLFYFNPFFQINIKNFLRLL